MKILSKCEYSLPSSVVIGKFDGVHKGHQKLISIAKEISKKENLTLLAFTFDSSGECITDSDEKAHLLKALGVDLFYSQNFSEDFKNTSPEDFIDLLKTKLNAKHIVVGFNFKFGRKRCGDTALMEKLCLEKGIKITVCKPVMFNGEPISSTRIRASLKDGDMESAKNMLGRNFSVRSKVISGKMLGRQMGFPTANMEISHFSLIPKHGVYASFVKLADTTYPAITNIGKNPTVDSDGAIKAETHIIGFNGDLYGKELSIGFLKRLRDEADFENIENLKSQLLSDKKCATEIFKTIVDK